MSTTDHTSEDNTMIPAYKGFNRDLTCRGFQYAEGETYQTDRAELCATGFHACPMPLDTLRYYPPGTSVYHAVEVDADAHRGDDKMVSKRIKIGRRMSLAELIEAHLSLAFKRADEAEGADRSTAATSGDGSTSATSGCESTAATSGNWSTAATSGNWSTAATSGDGSTSATSGYESTAATSGDWSTAATSGYRSTAATSGDGATAATSGDVATAAASGGWSTAATSGDKSMAKVEGEHSIAVAGGYRCRAMGSLGCWLVLAERDYYGAITHLEAAQVDGERIKPDVAYMLRNGKVVKA